MLPRGFEKYIWLFLHLEFTLRIKYRLMSLPMVLVNSPVYETANPKGHECSYQNLKDKEQNRISAIKVAKTLVEYKHS